MLILLSLRERLWPSKRLSLAKVQVLPRPGRSLGLTRASWELDLPRSWGLKKSGE